MAFQTSIGAGIYTTLAVSKTAVVTEPTNQATWTGFFTTATNIVPINHIRDLPMFGNQANIVKVPGYGRASELSIGAQSQSQDLTITVNYVPSEWVPGQWLYDAIASNLSMVFQLSFLYAKPPALTTIAAGLGAVDNTNIYFLGKLESIEIAPSLTDAGTAKIAISRQSDFSDPYTIASV